MNEGNKDRQLHRVPRGHQSGLPTRLLDWTDNPLVACFFAVDENSEDDGVIYAYHNESYIPVDRHPDPFQYQKRLIQGWNSLDFMEARIRLQVKSKVVKVFVLRVPEFLKTDKAQPLQMSRISLYNTGNFFFR